MFLATIMTVVLEEKFYTIPEFLTLSLEDDIEGEYELIGGKSGQYGCWKNM